MINYHMINSAVNHMPTPAPDKEVLKIVDSGGLFFSNCTVALMDIVRYFNEYKGLPDEVDRTAQYMHYKSYAGQNLIPEFFYADERSTRIPYTADVPMDFDCMSIQFAPYRHLPFDAWTPFIYKYFHPSDEVATLYANMSLPLDLDSTCAVLYRGNDKHRETTTPSYDDFLERAVDVKAENPSVTFLVIPDETEFLEAFQDAFPFDTFSFDQVSHMAKQDSAIPFETPRHERGQQAKVFFAALRAVANCEHLITHSGNCGLWASLYRGHNNNLHQYFNGAWI